MSAPQKVRLESLDAFRGFTILGMVFVIAVAAGSYWKELANPMPQTMSWFGSNPVSTWFHADVGFEIWKHAQETEGLVAEQFQSLPEYSPIMMRRNIGVTFTDLIAPWFVFIVGACIPLSRARHGSDWWWHVGWRTMMLILAGVVYMSLVIRQVSWWWGVLQAIGVAYFMGAALCRLPAGPARWGALFGVAGFNFLMTDSFPWWTNAFEPASPFIEPAPFGTLANPGGDWLRPWTVHCQPWLSISYGVMTMIGVLVGEALVTGNRSLITRRCLTVGALFTILGYAIHKAGFVMGDFNWCFKKPDVTTSYAFFTAGLGALCFLGFYWLIDVMGWRGWARPLAVFGVNPLLAYFLMIIQRRAFESLGVINFFNRVEGNELVANWARFFGSADEPAQWVTGYFEKGGYGGVFWGLAWTFCLWLIVLWCNRRNLYWKF